MTTIFPRTTDKDLIESGWTLDKAFLEEVKSMPISSPQSIYSFCHLSTGSIEALLLAAEKVINEDNIKRKVVSP